MDFDLRKSKGSKHGDSEEDWEQLSDQNFRRRIQNRISQRKHRENLKRQREEETENPLPSRASDKPTSCNKNQELVWMQPNTISMSGQPKKVKISPPTKTAEDFTTSSSEDTTSNVLPFHGPKRPLSPASSGSMNQSRPPYTTLNMNGLEFLKSMETPPGQFEGSMSSNSIRHQPGLQTPESPRELSLGENFLGGDGSMTNDLLDESLDMLFLQYQDSDIFQGHLEFLDQGMSMNNSPISFDLKPPPPPSSTPQPQTRGPSENDNVVPPTGTTAATTQQPEAPPRRTSSWDGKDTIGFTSLHLAAQHSHVAILNILLDNGFDINEPSDEGETALHLAARESHIDVAQLLLKKGASTTLRNDKGQTALHAAVRGGHVPMVALLLDYMGDSGIRDFNGQSALHVAVKLGQEDVVRLMIGKGVDVKIKVGV